MTLKISQRSKNGTALQSSSSTPRYLSEENRNSDEKRYMPAVFTAALFTIATRRKQPKGPSVDEGIKEMWYIYMFVCVYIGVVHPHLFSTYLGFYFGCCVLATRAYL